MLQKDAIELIEVDFHPIEAVVDIDDALRENAPRIHDARRSNVVARFRVKKGDADAALASAPRKLHHTFYNHRYVALPIECRGVIADYDPGTNFDYDLGVNTGGALVSMRGSKTTGDG